MIDRIERIVRLKSMLAQTAPSGRLESVLDELPAAASARGPEERAVAAAEADIRSGLQKLARDDEAEVTPSELHAIEAIVMPRHRPVVFVRERAYDQLDGIWSHLNDPVVRERLTPLLGSIGRIELPNDSRLPFGGTGFLVGENLLMTNRHVARLFAEGLGLAQRLTYRPGDAAVDFHCWVDSEPTDRTAYFTVLEVEMIHPFWDLALLRVDGLANGFEPLRLSVRPPEELADQDVIAVGYPARDARNDLALQDEIFNKQYDVKRLQPGKLRVRESIRSFEHQVNAVTHDSSTLGGNSGSAVIDVQTGEVVGLHFAGEYLKANYAVPTFELARDSRVVDLGLRFSGSVPPTSEWASAWSLVGAGEALPVDASAGDTSAAATDPGTTPQAPAPATTSGAQATLSFNLPVTITVSIGQPTLLGTAREVAPPELEAMRMQVPVIFGGLEQRTGYQADFLELAGQATIPLPRLTTIGKRVVAKLEDGSHELKYHKFSVVMHRGRRLALFTAANADWRVNRRLVNGRKPTRADLTGLPPNTAEQWVTDWRICREHQLPDLFFTRDSGAFDKGHLVRRDDVCWGSSFEDIQKGNGDTYHTTNCSPQTSGFNQSARGQDNWGDLENLVQKETRTEKAIILSGPVLADDDRRFRGRDESGVILVQVPRRFWKIIVVKGAAGPEAYGFLLEQDLTAVRLEMAVPANWRRRMCKITEIERLLNGLARLPALTGIDRFASVASGRIASRLR